MTDLSRKVDYLFGFMRMVVVELRNLANNEPEIARQLRYIADQVETEAADLRHVAGGNGVGFV